MDRDKLAALVAAALLAGGAWWWWRGRAQAPPVEAGPVLAEGDGLEWLGQLAAPVREIGAAVQSAAEEIVSAVTPGPWQPSAKAAPFLPLVYAAEDAAGAPRNLFARQIQKESSWNPRAVNPRSGAKGLGQFMDATWAEWGRGDVFDPAANIDAVGRYMAWLYRRHGDWKTALAAYNFGTGNVGAGRAWPAETRDYVASIAGDVGLG